MTPAGENNQTGSWTWQTIFSTPAPNILGLPNPPPLQSKFLVGLLIFVVKQGVWMGRSTNKKMEEVGSEAMIAAKCCNTRQSNRIQCSSSFHEIRGRNDLNEMPAGEKITKWIEALHKHRIE